VVEIYLNKIKIRISQKPNVSYVFYANFVYRLHSFMAILAEIHRVKIT
jgi:hypothetical protein